ncbi:MAG: DUF1801 domain-containing protein [Flavobacteriales bacterium]
MKIEANTVDEYFEKVPQERQVVMNKLRGIINTHLPIGFKEVLGYGMPSWVVPHSIYPSGYHTTPELPLPFMSLASQKNFIGFYHMGIYADPNLLKWWQTEYTKHCQRKLDMGKSCIRLKYMEDIPFDLIRELCQKISPQDWIVTYESNFKK